MPQPLLRDELPDLLGAALDDVLRELRYCAGAPGHHFAGGQIGRAQASAIERGFLCADTVRVGFLAPTASGRLFMAKYPA